MSWLFRLRKLFDVLRVPAWRRAFLRWGVAAGAEHSGVLLNLGEIRTVVDIGANRGQFALVARHEFPNASIVSFEPLPKPAATYRNVFDGDPAASIHQVAIGPRTGDAVMHVSERDDSSSLLPISAEQERIFPGTASVGTQTVPMATLSDHATASEISAPAILKIDVQGFELDALNGCEDLIDRFDWIYVECSFRELYEGQAFADQVIAWLREHNFVLRGLYNASYDGQGCAVQADFLFARGETC